MFTIKLDTLFLCLVLMASGMSEPITINVDVGSRNASLHISGHIEDLITDIDREAFQISDENLKLGIEIIMNELPREVSLGNWTVYKKKMWSPVKRILIPIRAKVLSMHNEPATLSYQRLNNTYSKKAIFSASISSEVRNTISSTWTESSTREVGTQITFGITLLSISSHVSFMTTWGNTTSTEKSTVFGASSGVSLELAPGEEVEAILTATRGVAEIEVEYMAGLKGDVACRFRKPHKGRTLWRQDINTVLDAMELPAYISSSRQNMRIQAYSEAKVTLVNATSKEIIAEKPAAFSR